MSIINLNSVSVTLGASLFANLDLTIGKGDRIGLVAANGRGKSTLLRCLAGEMEPTSGAITWARGLRVGHVAQELPEALAALAALPLHEMVLSALPADQAEFESWRVDIVLDDLEIPVDLRTLAVGSLSGGWQRLAMLARAWVVEPDMLLMDEPTNHLDLSRIGFLQRWIAALPRDFPLLIASHDRAFLDAVCTRTLFLRAEASRVFQLPYARARAALDEADAADERRFENEMNKASQLRRQAAKLKNIGINSGSDLLITKTKQLSDRADKLVEAARPAHQERSAGAIQLGNSGTHAKALLSLDGAQVCAPDGRVLLKTGQLWIAPGDRVVLLGANGAGKSQLVAMVHRAIMGAAEAGVRAAPSVVLGFSDQELSQLEGAGTPAQAVAGRFDVGDQRARGLMAGAGINIDMQTRPIAALSGGQKARLAMLVLRLTGPNFYLLDEPTNHLDIEGQEALEGELCAQEAACLLVSHDRTFAREVGNRFWLIEKGRLREIEGPEGFFAAALGA